jgi:hypothetical protein
MAQIGVFWIYRNEIIGKARNLSEGRENIPGLIDSPDNHIDLWENSLNFDIPFPELRGSEYQDIPRGRVIYKTQSHEAIVYMDMSLDSENAKKLVSEFFELNDVNIIWKSDPHYTTDAQRLNELFDD